MKQTKWLISLSACLVLMAASSAGVKGKLAIPCQAREQDSFDPSLWGGCLVWHTVEPLFSD